MATARKRRASTREQPPTRRVKTSSAPAKTQEDATTQDAAPVTGGQEQKEGSSGLLEYTHLEIRAHPYNYIPGDSESDEDEDEDEDEEEVEKEQEEEGNEDGRPAKADAPPPAPRDYRVTMLAATATLLKKYWHDAFKRDQDAFGMHFYNDYTGYGLQEIIENQLNAFDELMKEAEPDAIKLWIQLSAFAHWAALQGLGQWMMIDDGDRWRDTVSMIGIAMLATLNALERAQLLDKESPLSDLGPVLALLGNFIAECHGLIGEVPCFEGHEKEACWPSIIVEYAKRHNIEITGVHDIKKDFVERFDDEDKAKGWKPKAGVDRWGWKTKFRQMVQRHGTEIGRSRKLRLGGDNYDIFKRTSRERKEASYIGGDPLDPKNPDNILGRLPSEPEP